MLIFFALHPYIILQKKKGAIKLPLKKHLKPILYLSACMELISMKTNTLRT